MNKTEKWREACCHLKDNGVLFLVMPLHTWEDYIPIGKPTFKLPIDCYAIKQQPIPNRQDWREWCKGLQDVGVKFEIDSYNDGWRECICRFDADRAGYRIAQQPIPEKIGEIMEEPEYIILLQANTDRPPTQEGKAIPAKSFPIKQKPDQEIPHRELQIQWHEDKLESLKNKTPMREWEVKYWDRNEFGLVEEPLWDVKCEYRRKPKVKKVTYWHCLCKSEYGTIVTGSYESKEHLIQCLTDDGHIILSPITETTVEMETPE